MRFKGWSKTPTSKPLAATGALITAVSVLFCVFKGMEMPRSVVDMLIWFDALTIGGYMGKSVIENNWGPRDGQATGAGAGRGYDDEQGS